MAIGDLGYLESEDCTARLTDGGISGGCDHDLVLRYKHDGNPDDIPTIIVDTSEASI